MYNRGKKNKSLEPAAVEIPHTMRKTFTRLVSQRRGNIGSI